MKNYSAKSYSASKSFIKTVIRLGILAVPMVLTLLPEAWMNLSVSAVLYMAFDWLKARYPLS